MKITTIMSNKKVALGAATLATGAIIGMGVLAGTAQAESPSPSPTGSSSTASSSGTSSTGSGSANTSEKSGRPERQRGTEVTGEELAKVTAAVKAKDSGVTVSKAVQTSDGS